MSGTSKGAMGGRSRAAVSRSSRMAGRRASAPGSRATFRRNALVSRRARSASSSNDAPF